MTGDGSEPILFPDLGPPLADFTVWGTAISQGSKKAHAITNRAGQPVMRTTKAGKRVVAVSMREQMDETLKVWREQVMRAATEEMLIHGHATEKNRKWLPYEPTRMLAAGEWELCDAHPDGAACGHPYPIAPTVGRTGVIAALVLTVPKPASAPKQIRTWPSGPPDVSKLLRSTEDAITIAGLWRDDARVIAYRILAKVYPREGALWMGCPDLSLPEPGARIMLWAANPAVDLSGTQVQDTLTVDAVTDGR